MNNQPNMSEKELITDLLYEEKHLVKQYASDVVETLVVAAQDITTNLTECATISTAFLIRCSSAAGTKSRARRIRCKYRQAGYAAA